MFPAGNLLGKSSSGIIPGKKVIVFEPVSKTKKPANNKNIKPEQDKKSSSSSSKPNNSFKEAMALNTITIYNRPLPNSKEDPPVMEGKKYSKYNDDSDEELDSSGHDYGYPHDIPDVFPDNSSSGSDDDIPVPPENFNSESDSASVDFIPGSSDTYLKSIDKSLKKIAKSIDNIDKVKELEKRVLILEETISNNRKHE